MKLVGSYDCVRIQFEQRKTTQKCLGLPLMEMPRSSYDYYDTEKHIYHSSLNRSKVAIESGNIVPPMTALLVGVSVAAGVQVSPMVRSCML